MNNLTKYLVVLLFVAGFSSGCDNILDPSADQNKPTGTSISSPEDLNAVILGSYDDLNQVELYGRDYYVSVDVMSDNAFSNGNSGRFINQDKFLFTPQTGYALDVWDAFYEVIGGVNLALENDLDSSGKVDDLEGEAHAIRAFSHMNLLLAYGQQYVSGGSNEGIPYKTRYITADEAEGDDFAPSRDAVSDVWTSVGDDLDTAISLMSESSTVIDDKDLATRLDYWGVRALQSRYYLFTEQYDKVVTVAEDIIANAGYGITPAADLKAEWESGSGPNSLFESAFTTTDRLGTDNIARIYRATNYGDVEATEDLYTSHASDDARADLYSVTVDGNGATHYRMNSKYTDETGSDNVRIIRYAEVILNYAEALAQPGVSGKETAVDALNLLADKRYTGGSPYSGSVTEQDVWKERRLELAFEGHRLYDLLRTGRDIPVGGGNSYRTAPISYGEYNTALPIPDAEVRANSNIPQNKGY